jgi:protease I
LTRERPEKLDFVANSLPKSVPFVREIAEAKKPIAAICHAAWTLIEAGVAKGRTLTS